MTVVGNVDLLKEPRAAIFNSRQGKTPDSAAIWLNNTIELSKLLVDHKAAVISSLGMTTWELVTWQVAALGGSLILVIPDVEEEAIPGMARSVVEDFELEGVKVLFIFPDREVLPDKHYRRLPKKDFWIASMSDRIYPVSVRPGGNQSKIVELFSIVPGRVSDKFVTDYEKPRGSGFHPEELAKLRPGEAGEWDYLTHWTRTAIEPWPGESKAEFYRSFTERSSGYSHDGFNTLNKILRDMTIFGSDKLIRGGNKAVSLTRLPVWQIAGQIQWRGALHRWTFEPYGIAVKKSKLESLGARKVLYGHGYQYRFCSEADRSFFQSYDTDGYDWRSEREWRITGDLDLRKLGPEDAVIIVRTLAEAEELGEGSPFPVKYWDEFGVENNEEPAE